MYWHVLCVRYVLYVVVCIGKYLYYLYVLYMWYVLYVLYVFVCMLMYKFVLACITCILEGQRMLGDTLSQMKITSAK